METTEKKSTEKKQMVLSEKLAAIQRELTAPKSNKNSFGNYSYRTFESINEALKPLLEKYNCTLFLEDEIFAVEGIIFNKTTASIISNDDDGGFMKVASSCPLDLTHRGMSAEQCGGSTLSYSRKYCLQGLFLIDGNADPDSMQPITIADQVARCKSIKELLQLWSSLTEEEGTDERIKAIFNKRKEQLSK